MVKPTAADIVAARRLNGELSGAYTHSMCFALPGAEFCPHVLAGSGDPILDLTAEQREVWIGGHLTRWQMTPYRHHSFVERPGQSTYPFDKDILCECGNTRGQKAHVLCISVTSALRQTSSKGN